MLISYNGNRSSKVDLHVREYLKNILSLANLISPRVKQMHVGKRATRMLICGLILIYHPDLATQYPSSFNNLPSFLQFVGDGDNGLLGYCNCLSMQNSNLAQHYSSQILSMQYNYTIHI